MAIRYNKLWKRLIGENMMKVDLRDQAGITTNALAKLGKNEYVRLLFRQDLAFAAKSVQKHIFSK